MIKSSLKKKNSFILTSLDKSPSDILKFKNGNIRLIKKNSKAKINSISLTNNNNREKRNLSETSGNSKNSDKEKKNRKLLINKSLNLTNDFEKINKGRNSFLKRNGVKTENKSQLKISLDKLVYIKEPEKKKLNNSKNLSLNIENSKNENKKKYGVKILHSRNLNSETINYNSHKTFISFLEKTSNEIERKSSKNSLNNNENINNKDNNNNTFYSPKIHLKNNSSHEISNIYNINNNYNNNHIQLIDHSSTTKSLNYFYLNKNPNYFSSSNDQISTDTNLLPNKNYSQINNNSTVYNNNNYINNEINNNKNNNNPIKRKSKNFHGIFHQSVREQIDELDKKNEHPPILKVRTLNRPNLKINIFQEKTSSTDNQINNTSLSLSNNLTINNSETENNNNNYYNKTENIFENNVLTENNNDSKLSQMRKESNFLKKLKEHHKKGISNFKTLKKKKKKKEEESIILKDPIKSAESDINNLIKKSNKKIISFKKQLSKIPEISIKNSEEKEKTKNKSSSSKHIKEIIDINNHLKKLNRNKSLNVKKGENIFNNIIDELVKKKSVENNNFEIDASFESFDSEKSIKKQPRKRSNSILAFFRASSLRLTMNEYHFNSNKNLVDLKKQKLIIHCRYDIRNFTDKIDNIKNNIKDKLISDSFIQNNYYKSILLNETINNNIPEKNTICLIPCEKYFIDFKEKNFNEFNSDINKLITFQNKIIENILPESIKRLILKKNLKVNLYEHIIKGKYLETDLGTMDNLFNSNLLNHFEKLRRPTLRSFKKFNRHFTQILPIILSGKAVEYFNRFLIRDTLLDEINNKKEQEEIHKRKKFKTGKVIKFLSHHHHFKFFERNMVKTLRIRLVSKPNIIRANSTYSHNKSSKYEKNKMSILNESFFERKRNYLQNKYIEIQKKKEAKKKENSISRKKAISLYISPQNSLSEKKMTYFNNISLRKFDKGLAIDRTLNIKDDLIKKCKNYYEVLFLYIKYGEYHKFKKIFEYFNLSTEIYDNEGNSLLNLAVQCESTKLVKYLLLKDANPNSQNYKLNSPLHYALIYQNFEIADILIKYGACENLKNGEGLTPWQCLNN